MSDPERAAIRMWSWGTMPAVGRRAFVLKMARSLMDKNKFSVPESWMSAWAEAARGLAEAAGPEEADDVEILSAEQVPPQARMDDGDWTRLRSLRPDSPLDEALIHKAAIEYVLSDYGGAVPSELVEITLAST